jgi:uncharacterized protein YjbI with pentapeptide repeats
MTPNRIVAILTPLVFAPAAGAASAWLASHFPGTDIKSSDLQAIFVGGALIALAPAAQWLHGWQKYEARQADAEQAIELANANAMALQASQLGASDLDFDNATLDGATLDGATLDGAALDGLGADDDVNADLNLLVGDEEPTSIPG